MFFFSNLYFHVILMIMIMMMIMMFSLSFFVNLVLISSLLMISNSDGTSLAARFRTLFDYPADALSVNDLEGQEAKVIMPNMLESR